MKRETNILGNVLVISSTTDNLALVREFIETKGREFGLSAKEISHISLAVDEACTNIIKHAYNNSKNEKIKIKIEKKEKRITVTLTDNGSHFDPSVIPEPNIVEKQKMKKGGGLGIFLMKRLMDEVKYNAKGSSNELILIKHLV